MTARPFVAAIALLLSVSQAAAQGYPTLPATPWSRARHVSLPGTCGGALIPRPGGGAAVALSSPTGIAMVGGDGALTRAWRTDFRADEAWWVGRESLHAMRGRSTLMSFGVDGTLRGVHPLPDAPIGHVARHGAQESVLAYASATAVLATRAGWDGTPIASVIGAGGWRPATSGPALDAQGAVWIAAGAGLVRVFPTRRQVALERGVRRLVPREGGGLFALVEGGIVALDRDANVLGRNAIDATVVDLAALPDGGVAALVQTAPPRVLVFDGAATARARFEVGADAQGLTAGAGGAVLVGARDGTLEVHEADGALRWRMNLPGPIRPPAIALSPERFAVATERGEIIVLELAAAPDPR